MAVEHRKAIRRRFSQHAVLYTGKGAMVGSCVVRDISKGGARLSVATAANLPDEFVLVLSQSGGIKRKCRVVWRLERDVGVSFSSR